MGRYRDSDRAIINMITINAKKMYSVKVQLASFSLYIRFVLRSRSVYIYKHFYIQSIHMQMIRGSHSHSDSESEFESLISFWYAKSNNYESYSIYFYGPT